MSNKIENIFLEINTNYQGDVTNIVSGKFAIQEFKVGESIYNACSFLEGTLNALILNEPFVIESMVIQSNNIEYNIDLELNKFENFINVLIHDRTSVYKFVDKLNQGRNDLYFLKRQIAEKNKELVKLREIADKANAEKSRFLAMMSHEVRNPLNVILGYTELINKEETSLMAQEYLKYLTISGRNLKVIVDDILDLSRVEAGKLLLAKDPMSIVTILDQIEKNYNTSHKDLDIKLVFNISDDLPELVLGDDVRLIQILTNLINNSIKFTPRGSVTASVSLMFSDEEKAIISFKVKDTGRGMTAEQAAKVFDEYQQNRLSDNRMHNGVGLGLSIVKRLVNVMKGRINVDSFVNYGTTISVDIPFDLVADSNLIEKEDSDNKTVVSIKGKKVLVADDNYLNLSIVSHILKKEEVDYTLVKDGVEAIAAMDKDSFDIVLLDINMPNLKGDELIKRKEDMKKSNSEIPFLALTANNSKEDIEVYHELGFAGVIPKPFTAIQFVDILRQHLGESKSLKE